MHNTSTDAKEKTEKEVDQEIEIAKARLMWLTHTSIYARMVQSKIVGSHPERNIYGNIYRQHGRN